MVVVQFEMREENSLISGLAGHLKAVLLFGLLLGCLVEVWVALETDGERSFFRAQRVSLQARLTDVERRLSYLDQLQAAASDSSMSRKPPQQ